MSVMTPKEGNVFIATYGSLRRGMHNWRVNEYGNGQVVGLGNTDENYNLYDLGSFPSVSLAHNSHGAKVRVEVYEAPADETGMRGSYDRLEGYREGASHQFYNRTEIPVTMDNGDTLTAWIYHIDEDQSRPVVSGDWCLHRNPNYYTDLAAAEGEEFEAD